MNVPMSALSRWWKDSALTPVFYLNMSYLWKSPLNLYTQESSAVASWGFLPCGHWERARAVTSKWLFHSTTQVNNCQTDQGQQRGIRRSSVVSATSALTKGKSIFHDGSLPGWKSPSCILISKGWLSLSFSRAEASWDGVPSCPPTLVPP